MANDALLQAGLTAARAGDLETAAVLFAKLVKEEPSSEQGWLGLGFCFSDRNKREYCFRRVLAINPNNLQARQALDILQMPANEALPPSELKNPTQAPDGPQTETKPAVSPFLAREEPAGERNEPDFIQAMNRKVAEPEAVPNDHSDNTEEPLPAFLEPSSKPTEIPSTAPKKKNKIIPILLWFTGLFVVACLAGSIFFVSRLKYFAPRQTILESTATATETAFSTLTPTPTRSPSQTPTPTKSTPTSPALPTPASTLVYSPSFAKAACQFSPPEGVQVTCGYVTVPEDRTNPHTKSIQLAVAVFHDTGPDPAPDPVVFLQCGPGGEAVLLSADNFSTLVKPFLAKRDYITFDQRGTGISKPALGCEELEHVYKQDISGQIPASSRDYIYTNAFRSCHGAMTVGGIELNSYTTLASSDDLNDIVTALGYRQVNLYAASYGTRLALVTIRDHPGIVRSALLDSVVPIEVKLFNEDPLRYGSSLQALFDACAAQPPCNSAYPDLQTVFWNLVSQLDTKPVQVTAPQPVGSNTENIDGAYLIGMVLSFLKSTSLIAYVPEIIYNIKSGDYSTFVAMQSSLPYEFTGINIGLYISMMCHEHILSTTPEDLQAAMDSAHDLGRYFRLPFFGNAQTLFNTCKVWGTIPPSPGENDPVTSDIPTLIIEGKFDPVTPPIFGEQVAQKLSHSFYMEFPNQGHTPTVSDTSGCAFDSMLSFFDDPSKKPDMTCLSAIKGVDFVLPAPATP